MRRESVRGFSVFSRIFSLFAAAVAFSSLPAFSEEADEETSRPAPAYRTEILAGSTHALFDGRLGVMDLRFSDGNSADRSLLSTLDRSRQSFFSVTVGGREFRSNSSAVERRLRTDGSVALDFSSAGRFFATVALSQADDPLFALFDDGTGSSIPDKALKVEFSLTNSSEIPQRFSLRAFFDTILGENSKTHFSTGTGLEISSEAQFTAIEMKRERFLESSDGKRFQRFAFSDLPSFTTVANRDVLLRLMSSPGSRLRSDSGRSFSSASSFANSAVAFSWGDFLLQPLSSKKVSFYIIAGEKRKIDDRVWYFPTEADAGDFQDGFVQFGSEQRKPVGEREKSPQPERESLSGVETEIPEESPVQEPEKKEKVEFLVKSVEEYQLDPVYIQNLIDRINSIQNGSSIPTDSGELRRLNSELDAILAKLKGI